MKLWCLGFLAAAGVACAMFVGTGDEACPAPSARSVTAQFAPCLTR